MKNFKTTRQAVKNFPLRIILPFVTLSENRLLRMHWAARKAKQQEYLAYLTVAGAYDRRFFAGEKEKRTVEIYSYRKRRIDPDNLIGGMKPLIDCLRKMKLIWDDSPKYLDLTVVQETDGKDPRTEIVIYNED